MSKLYKNKKFGPYDPGVDIKGLIWACSAVGHQRWTLRGGCWVMLSLKLPVFTFKSDILRDGKMLVECSWAETVTYGHSCARTHKHTTLGQQRRWVLGKQAAAGGEEHKAGWLAKFYHLLWIAWDAHSAATRGMASIHMQAHIYRNTWVYFTALHFITVHHSELKGFKQTP